MAKNWFGQLQIRVRKHGYNMRYGYKFLQNIEQDITGKRKDTIGIKLTQKHF